MKNIFRPVRCGARQPSVGLGFLSEGCFAFVVFCLFTTTNPLDQIIGHKKITRNK